MAEMTGGELLLKCLKAEGATTLFGVLDGSYNAFLAKLNDYEIKYIAPRHEAAAAHIAEAWARGARCWLRSNKKLRSAKNTRTLKNIVKRRRIDPVPFTLRFRKTSCAARVIRIRSR
ncbi:MAG: hypothetical protein HZB52_08490 [Chloroflexi bacterium]|nr:hypothetical protein [Chloroflexota bacterium]